MKKHVFQRSRQADSSDWAEPEMRAYVGRSLQYAAQLYGDEDDLLLADGTKTTFDRGLPPPADL